MLFRSLILTAEGTKQSQILTAEGARQAAILEAEGYAKSAVLRAQGEAEAILTVFDAIHKGDPDPKLLGYQYIQMLPQLAQGDANKLWVIPSELTEALKGIGKAFTPQQSGAAPSTPTATSSATSATPPVTPSPSSPENPAPQG